MNQKYAYVSKHRANFDDVEEKFDKLNKFLADSCKAANEHAADLFFLQGYSKYESHQDLFKMVARLVSIDKKKVKIPETLGKKTTSRTSQSIIPRADYTKPKSFPFGTSPPPNKDKVEAESNIEINEFNQQ